jgi:hypothetical protein
MWAWSWVMNCGCRGQGFSDGAGWEESLYHVTLRVSPHPQSHLTFTSLHASPGPPAPDVEQVRVPVLQLSCCALSTVTDQCWPACRCNAIGRKVASHRMYPTTRTSE